METVLQGEGGGGLGDPSRRNFLQGVAALGASALLPSSQLSGQTPPSKARAIDCHHHFASPTYIKTLSPNAGHHNTGYSTRSASLLLKMWPTWSPAKDVDYMEQQGVATAVVDYPQVWYGDMDETRFLAREMNEFGAKMVSDYKGRFGLFALLPLPNIEDSLREIEYAFDILHADGVGIWTSYEHHWLGEQRFRPVFDELNRRKAVVFVHPVDAFEDMMVGLQTSSLEFLCDTMRTIFSLLATGAATRYGDVRFIFSHAGGAMPSLIERLGIAEPGAHNEVLARPAEPNSHLYHLRRFYYDVANSCNTVQLQGLKTIVGASQIVFGTDWPVIESPLRQLQGLQTCGFSAAELKGIHRGNAERLFPRLAGNGSA
jgi:predicted TIM-barrel fold metal-dependent hydrolase